MSKYLLRDVDGADLGGGQHLLLAAHQLLQEVNRDVVIRWQEYSTVRGQKVVDLALAVVLGLELLRGDPDTLAACASRVLLHCLVPVHHS